MRKFISVVGLSVLVLAWGHLLHAEPVALSIAFRNLCDDVITIRQISLHRGVSFYLSQPNRDLPPGQSWEFPVEIEFTPDRMALIVAVGGQTLKTMISPVPYNQSMVPRELRGCLEVMVRPSQAPTEGLPSTYQPPETGKPITPGLDLDRTLAALRARGIRVREEGSRDRPKLAGVDDPMLLRAISGSSAHLIWVSAPGTLRSVILWDSPTVDLDLVVFGLFPFGACFQLTPPGVLAELCDRAPWGPVPGSVFAVLVINWSAQPQAYVLALSR